MHLLAFSSSNKIEKKQRGKTKKKYERYMEFEDLVEPVSPTGQYFNNSTLSISILGVLESEIPIDITDAQVLSLLKDVFLPINQRFSSIMVEDKKGRKIWKKVEVFLEDHIKIPIFPSGLSPESYDECFDDYLSKLSLERFPQDKPLWEVHIFKYPTTNAAGNVIFRLHHALGDGYSIMGALLSCLQRADDPSLPLTFPSRQRSKSTNVHREKISVFSYVPKLFSSVFNTIYDVSWGILKSSLLEDDKTPIRSGNDGLEFQPTATTSMWFSLDQIKLIKTKLGVTINDVIAGITFFGARLYMQENNISQELNTKNSNSTALVLLSTRMLVDYKSVKEMTKVEAEMPWGNRFSFLHVPIPHFSECSDPLDFVFYSQKIIERKRRSFAVLVTSRLLEIMHKLKGYEAVARYIHSTLSNASMTISNIIGPVEQMALANHPVKGLYYTVAGSPQGLDISVISYMGKLRVTFGVKKGHIDCHKFKSCMENAFHIIFKSSQKNPTKDKFN
ncbi:hypothetical protein FEM48_Zijuj04G0122700 [Ziziphus jujuba var. spinosa]|uniref:Diacylglycerol O-acyltransferase n=1 Tax=Ziziphus jujuba var. spinosa TaxID=714518 RepID=A0A978VJU2_ZIZJJ|nr:hypothetical protein FEM48_Zijuj04G0122700 [Ziziphus jujuba var. spinosa]